MADGDQGAEALSKRELEVASAYASGESYKEIARDLGLSPTTVRTHLRTVYTKLGVTSKIELARLLEGDAVADQTLDQSEVAADLALELDDSIRRERSMAKVLKIVSDHDGNLDTVIDTVLDHALEICEAEFGVLFEFLDDGRAREMHSRNIEPDFAEWFVENGAFELDPATAIGRMAALRQTVNITDVRGEDVYKTGAPLRIATADLGKARSFAAIPMISGGRLIGAFTVYRTRVHPFNDRALELAQVFAAQAVIAIENVRQFRELQTRLESSQSNREILELIRTNRDDELPVFKAIAKNAVELCGAQFCMLWRYDGTDIHHCASHGFTPKFMDEYLVEYPMPPNPNGIVHQVIQVGKTVHLPNAQAEPYSDAAVARQHGYDYMLGVPVETDDGMWGIMVLAWPKGLKPEEQQVEILETFAAQAVIAIQNTRHFRELQSRLEHAAATREILGVLSESRNDEKPVFDVILRNAAKICGSPMARLEMVDEGRETFRCVAAWGEEMRSFKIDEAMPLDLPNDLPTALREGVLRHIPDLAKTELYMSGDPIRARMVDEEGYRTYLIVPLISNGQGIGGIVLSRREVAPFSESDIALLESFAAQAVIAIENVRQFKALEARTEEVQALNASLEERVEDQVGEIERMGRLKRFLSPAVADAVVTKGEEMLSSHRALIATLFCDIRGFTAFCETAEPEETIEVLQTYHEELGALISEHGGGADKRMGDGIMVIFNDPLPVEDPAGDAVRLALAMRERMVDLCKKWKRLGHRLGFGVGVSLGYATVGMVGSEGRFDYTASGTAVNLAARLCDQADDGEILLSPRAMTAVEDDFEAESAGEMSFKGIQHAVEVFRISGPVASVD